MQSNQQQPKQKRAMDQERKEQQHQRQFGCGHYFLFVSGCPGCCKREAVHSR